MNIKINGETQNLNKEKLTISELLIENNVEMPEMVSVQLNGSFLKKEEFDATVVKENDEVDFLYFMGGGE